METFTMKIDPRLDKILSELTGKTHKSKSQIIREALEEYREKLRKKELKEKMIASAKSIMRDKEAVREIEELEGTIEDGL